jgi:hypothetical protein
LLTDTQAKRRHATGVRRHAGERERYSVRLLAQEVSELLGQAAGHVAELGGWRDQEAFVASIHGTVFRMTAANISGAYLSRLNSSTMPDGERLWVRRSEGYDLKTQTGRDGALILLIAMMGYFQSGQAMIGQLQAVHG